MAGKAGPGVCLWGPCCILCGCVVFKNKTQLDKDKTGVLQPFRNWASSHLASRKNLEELYEMEGFCRQKAAGTRKRIISSFFGGRVGSLRPITSLLLTRKFQTVWLRLHSWERLKLQLGQVLSLGWLPPGLSTSDSIGGLLSLFASS